MKLDGAYSQALSGIQRGLVSAREHAAEIVDAGRPGGDKSTAGLIEPMVGLKLDRLQVQASSAVLRAYDEMIGTLFDKKV